MSLKFNNHFFSDSNNDVNNDTIFKPNYDFDDESTDCFNKEPSKQNTPPRFIKKAKKVPEHAQPSHAQKFYHNQMCDNKDNSRAKFSDTIKSACSNHVMHKNYDQMFRHQNKNGDVVAHCKHR